MRINNEARTMNNKGHKKLFFLNVKLNNVPVRPMAIIYETPVNL